MSSIEEVRGPYPEYQKIRDAARNPRALEHGSFTAPDREGRPRGAKVAAIVRVRAAVRHIVRGARLRR